MNTEDKKIVMVDYGMGNLQSISNAFAAIEQEISIVDTPDGLETADAIILPGVGAFGDGMRNLREAGMEEALTKAVLDEKKPYLGICLGMQFLGRKSYENGEHEGLGWIPGEVRLIEPIDKSFKVPHMGWNDIKRETPCALFEGLDEGPVFYFVHSYHLEVDEQHSGLVTSSCWHSMPITASVQKENIFGVQFHPEKSQQAGLSVLRNFLLSIQGSAPDA